MIVSWIGDGDNAKLSITIIDGSGSKLMSLRGGTGSPSAFKMTKPLPALIVSPISGTKFVSEKQLTTLSKKPLRTIAREPSRMDVSWSPLLVRRKGNDSSGLWETTSAYSGALANMLSVQSDDARVRLWRGKPPADASAAESRKADLLAYIDLEWGRPTRADGTEDMSGTHVYRVYWAPGTGEWAEDDRCLLLTLLTDLFWSLGDMSLHFGGLLWATHAHGAAEQELEATQSIVTQALARDMQRERLLQVLRL
jgi:hypothetical protein